VLGLGHLDAADCLVALETVGCAHFGPGGEGVVRLQAGRDSDGQLHLLASARPLGAEPECWRALHSQVPHPGAGRWAGAKLAGLPAFARARQEARQAGCEEALLYSSAGALVEGARSNLFLVDAGGHLRTPPVSAGAVAGVARALLLDRIPEIRQEPIQQRELSTAQELIAVNAVRGVRPVVGLDGRALGGGRAGPVAARLAAALAEG